MYYYLLSLELDKCHDVPHVLNNYYSQKYSKNKMESILNIIR